MSKLAREPGARFAGMAVARARTQSAERRSNRDAA
jgi:hypothetical protein